MKSIYQQVLGPDFDRLHPRIQERFGFSSKDGVASIGRGVMRRIWHGSTLVRPFLWIGTHRHIMFPEQGTDIPFEVANYAFRDHRGREIVSWVRTFWFPERQRRFDAYMAMGADGKRIIDYFGTHGHYGTDLKLSVQADGGLSIVSDLHRFYLGGLTIPFPEWLAGRAHVTERFDDAKDCYCIRVEVYNPIIGLIIGYEGEFRATWEAVDEIPQHILPVRKLPA